MLFKDFTIVCPACGGSIGFRIRTGDLRHVRPGILLEGEWPSSVSVQCVGCGTHIDLAVLVTNADESAPQVVMTNCRPA